MEATTPPSGDTLRSGLLSTKMRPPRPRADRLQRPLLVARLRAGLDRPLTLLSAPAGSGKTTLLGEWLQSCDRPVGWLALDAGDNDPLRFLAYLGAALGACDPALGRHIQDQLRAPPAWDVLVAELVNAVAAVQPFVLVLDDYHVITAAPVHALLTGLLEQAPAPLHLVIGTRADPPFPLARLRVRGALTELRAPDLRFTPQEIAALLGGVYRVPVMPAQIARLADRTEGWAAGLQMAALALHGREDVERFVDRFSGGHQYVLDYLVEEVLVHQPAEIQHFLLGTAILERLCAELCDAVLGKAEGERVREESGADGGQIAHADIPRPSSFILDQLERSNLFLIPLDDERRWYRYHHLFGDLLRQRLGQSLAAGKIAELHIRASEWYEQNNLTLDRKSVV